MPLSQTKTGIIVFSKEELERTPTLPLKYKLVSDSSLVARLNLESADLEIERKAITKKIEIRSENIDALIQQYRTMEEILKEREKTADEEKRKDTENALLHPKTISRADLDEALKKRIYEIKNSDYKEIKSLFPTYNTTDKKWTSSETINPKKMSIPRKKSPLKKSPSSVKKSTFKKSSSADKKWHLKKRPSANQKGGSK